MYGYQGGERKGRINWETVTNIYPLLCKKQITSENLLHSTGNSMLGGDLNRKEIQKRGFICIHIADSLCCTAKITQYCKQLYLNVFFLIKDYFRGFLL